MAILDTKKWVTFMGTPCSKTNSVYEKFMGTPSPGRYMLSPREKRLRELAEEYHQSTEEYDRAICQDELRDGYRREIDVHVIPVTPAGRSRMNKFARQARERALREVHKLDFSEVDFKQALQAVTHDKS